MGFGGGLQHNSQLGGRERNHGSQGLTLGTILVDIEGALQGSIPSYSTNHK